MTQATIIKLHTGDQVVTALAGEPGRLYTQVVWIDAPIRAHKLANADVEKYGKPYDLVKPTIQGAARRMLKAGRKFGITKSAKQFLKEILA